MIGMQKISIAGKEYSLDWGRSHLGVKGSDADFRIENGRAARMLGALSLPEFISKEVARNR